MSNRGNPNPNPTPPADDETPAQASYETLADGTRKLSDGTLVKTNGQVVLPDGRIISGAPAVQHLATLGVEAPVAPQRERTSIINVFDPSNDGNGHGNGNNHPQNGNGHGGGHGHAHSNDDSSKSNRGLTAAILLAVVGIIIGIIALLTNGDNGDGTKALAKVEETDKNVATLANSLTEVAKSLKITQGDVSTLQTGMQGLEDKVNTAQLGVINLNEELAGLKTDVDIAKKDAAKAKKDAASALRLARATDKNVTAIAAGQATQDASIAALQADVASLKTTPPKVGGADPIKVRINQPGGGVEEYNLRN